MDAQFNSLMSLGTRNYFAQSPQRPRALLALCPSQLAVADTTGPITWIGRAPCVPGTEGAGRDRVLLEATSWATLWRRAQLRSACPSHGDTLHLASPWPHRPTSSTSARAAIAP